MGVELKMMGASLGSGPEGCTAGGDLIFGEVEEQLFDLIVVVCLPEVASPCDAVLERLRTLVHQDLLDCLECFQLEK